MSEVRHVVWSNENLNIEDGWREAYAEFLEINELDRDPDDEAAIYNYMVETNSEYLDDERANLNVQLESSILVIADVGRWNGRSDGYAVIESGNIKDCLYTECDYATWYVDSDGDFRCDAVHHEVINRNPDLEPKKVGLDKQISAAETSVKSECVVRDIDYGQER